MQIETWENVSNGLVVIKRYNQQNGMWTNERIRPGASFNLPTQDRLLMERDCQDPEFNWFRNGFLRPIDLGENPDEELVANPNLVSEAEILDMLSTMPVAEFKEKVGEITNLGTLNHFIALAESEDSDAKVSNVKALKARKRELTKKEVTEIDTISVGPDRGPAMTPPGRSMVLDI